MEELNGLRLFPRSTWEAFPAIAREMFQKRSSVGPVYVVSSPMMDKYGGILHTESRWQAFYDVQGNFAWCVTVIDSWNGPHPPHPLSAPTQPSAAEVAHHHPHQHHHPFVDHYPLDDLFGDHLTLNNSS